MKRLYAILSLIGAAVTIPDHYQNFDWCKLSCPTYNPFEFAPHVACTFKGDCLNIEEPCKFETLDKQRIVEDHNRLRNLFALGNDPNSNGLQVANMLMVEWDEGLEFTAHCNLKNCPAQMEHDKCHITEQFSTSGQNLAWSWSSATLDCVEDASKRVRAWYDEITETTLSELKHLSLSFNTDNPRIGHFTQMVWANLTHIGCALYSRNSNGKSCMLACNYGPAGNIIGTPMFMEGQPASACPNGLGPTSEYSGLCGRASAVIVGYLGLWSLLVIVLV